MNRVLKPTGYELIRINKKRAVGIDLAPVIGALATGAGRGVTVVQVGANDGITSDPVFRAILEHAAIAILVEPQRHLIERLRNNYERFSGDLRIRNEAVGRHEYSTFYRVSPELHERYQAERGSDPTGVASFSRDHVVRHLSKLGLSPGQLDQAVVAEEVACTTLSRLLKEEKAERPVFLQLDCEGYDWQALQTLEDWRPDAINFEASHLSPDERRSCEAWLHTEGYDVYAHAPDCLAVRTRATAIGVSRTR